MTDLLGARGCCRAIPARLAGTTISAINFSWTPVIRKFGAAFK
jgi:hypothetical protein